MTARHAAVPAIAAALALAALTLAAAQHNANPPAAPQQNPDKPSPYVLHHTLNRIDGTPQKLDHYKGKVVMIVNTASLCGLTPQYEALQNLYQARKDQGLVILAFPANNFRNQEPGTDAEIAEFCSAKYNITFPVFSKISVGGEDCSPLYHQLINQPEPLGGPIQWNFTKFLVDRQGNVVARFEPRTRPDDPAITAKLDELLGAPAPASADQDNVEAGS